MKTPSVILEALARHYQQSQAGRTGQSSRDVTVDVENLLSAAGVAEGEARALAEQQLREAEKLGILKIEPLHKRDPSFMGVVRLSPANEEQFFAYVGQLSPGGRRQVLAAQFAEASLHEIPNTWREGWQRWCEKMRQAALRGESVDPFDREPSAENAKLLALLPRVLKWQGESLVRFASCVLCGDSKALESLAAKEKTGELRDKLRGKIGRLLEEITSGEIRALDDLGILPNPRFALMHGPLKLRLDGEWLDLGRLQGAFRLAQSDIDRAESIISTARRCLTVENETSFHELAKLRSGELLIHTSFPGSGTLALLKRLPPELEFWHFGDSDEAGFEILRVLREQSNRDFQPFHMQKGRVPFEQESLGRPTTNQWPFFSLAAGWSFTAR
jgi:hypothetical protein